jgi:hypothetical protein
VHLEAIDKRLISTGCVVASLICLWFAIYGIRSGVVFAPRGRSHTVPIQRDQQPLEFWFSVWLYIGVSVTP